MAQQMTAKGHHRRQKLIQSAASLLSSGGPRAVTMRAAARLADLSPSSTVYYFDDREELLAEAAKLNIRAWAHIAEAIADEAENHHPETGTDEVIEYLIRAMISRPAPLLGHYLELISAGDNETISTAYRAGRGRLDNAISRILAVAKIPYPAELVIAVIDGGIVTALSEGRDPHATVETLLRQLISLPAYEPGPDSIGPAPPHSTEEESTKR
ncbi:TetR/AcrR family transcriptional regulator [Cutibacterium namnetense]|mgnify:FL=1|uniref:Transcriptional regulator, TetR family n=2 Tax=Cutibacterium namnetense TaxID=1574624 RepID=F9NVD7_9ACTN|nr:TetR family transcriptional regulator [Cutibacterium namnetense]EGR96964.1 transcriptional regulator, TetR family [ [[Propionibacterium] namnetense SK182B-JCVI]REB70260.1 TetR/AcrR family transcriptional regulator [Cutibacterium namnetense]